MMRSMFAGIVGLKSQQTAMDIIGNNISNVNTVGFKASRVTFQDVFSETLRGASAPGGSNGGQNPQQVGLGVGIASIDVLQNPGSLELTGNPTDMAISGNGFFILRDGGNQVYTRAGNFTQDAQGYLVNPATGARLQGWQADSNGKFGIIDQSGLSDIRIPTGDVLLATPTANITLGNSLDANAPLAGAGATPAAGSTTSTSTKVYDSLGRLATVNITFTHTAANAWTFALSSADPLFAAANSGPTTPAGTGNQIVFNTDGSLKSVGTVTAKPFTANTTFTTAGTQAQTVAIDFSNLTQPAIAADGSGSTVQFTDRDGNQAGSLNTFNVDARGVVSGVYSNGQKKAICMVGLATFSNPSGLEKSGSNSYVNSKNSGLPQIGQPGLGGRGQIAPSSLEGSNVDIAAEFTQMIITQRGFEANSRLITTTDQMLQELSNMKH